MAACDKKGNKIVGNMPELINSSVEFKGNDNILFCEENVKISNSKLVFNGNNSLIYLSSNMYYYRLNINAYNNSVVFIGKNVYFEEALVVIASEHKHVFIGDNCLFSFNILIRNTDAHLIYDVVTKNRINESKSVYIGDHVWIGHNVNVMKGVQIDSGSIIGAGSLVVGKRIPHNETWGGAPCKQLNVNVFWDKSCLHIFTEEMTKESKNYTNFIKNKNCFHDDFWIYHYDADEVIEWEFVENAFSHGMAKEKLEFLININKKVQKNRFVH